MRHPSDADELLEILCDEWGGVLADDPRLRVGEALRARWSTTSTPHSRIASGSPPADLTPAAALATLGFICYTTGVSNEMLTDDELEQLIRLARRVVWAGPEVTRRVEEQGIHVTAANFYSVIPSVKEVLSSFEYAEQEGPYHSPGVFDRDRIAAFVDAIDQYADEFDPPLDGDAENPASFYWRNPAFSFSDAMAYYCVVRHLRPQRILEVGAGYSTLVADQALRRNGTGELVLLEPYPKAFLRRLGTVTELLEMPVQQVDLPRLIALIESADVWFIDSTHTVKIGSDCCYLYLKAMPALQKRVIVHSHDIMLPYVHAAKWPLERKVFWTESYLLYAYLLDNPKANVLFGSNYVQKFLSDRMKRLMRGRYPGGGGSLWYQVDPSRGRS
jgi:hypothetical protein